MTTPNPKGETPDRADQRSREAHRATERTRQGRSARAIRGGNLYVKSEL